MTSPATNAIRSTFVSRSVRLNPRPCDKCVRTTSPSSNVTVRRRSVSRSRRIPAIVVLPAPLRPVSQTHTPPAFIRVRSKNALCEWRHRACGEPLHIRIHHHLHQLLEVDLLLPAEDALRL